jgi:glycosyltransferase involved in cell wall biosynthesis
MIHSLQNDDKFFSKFKIYNIFLISLVFIYFYNPEIFMNNNFDFKYKKIKEFEDSSFKSFIKNFFTNQISDMKKFREINCKNILLNNISFHKNEYPDVSIIITVYNQANCFHSALRSVQNQSLKNIEIIIIDDCSLDNSAEEIEKYMKEDNRIIFLKHESNDGKIKSRSDGIRMAKGKYITIIDGDDSLSNENILYNSFTIASLADLDVVGFYISFFTRKKYKNLNIYKNIKNLNNRIIYQPELYYKFVRFVEKDAIEGFANRNIVSKLIRNKVFKEVLEYIGPKYTEDYLLEYEDTIMSISLFRIANSYYNMEESGYYYAQEECEDIFPLSGKKKCKPKNFIINKELDPIK